MSPNASRRLDRDTSDYDMMLFTGSSNPDLARRIARKLGIGLGLANMSRFSDAEISYEIFENVRGRDVFIVQPTCAPANRHVMELLIMIDALRRASAGRITTIIPYYGYARQDRRPRSTRVPITARLVADMIGSAGADRALTVDLHADQIQGFFSIPMDNVYASPVLLSDIWKKSLNNSVVVSPDVGGVVRARAIAKQLDDADLAIIDKRRPKANVAQVMNIIGDVEGRNCILVDDMVDTAGTLCKAADALIEHGATQVSAYCSHAVLSGDAIHNIKESKLHELVVTDSIPLRDNARDCNKIRQVSIASMLAETMLRIHKEQSVSSLFI